MISDWTELAIGIILIVSPWILGFSDITVAKWGNIVIGLVLVLMNAWTIFARTVPPAPSQPETKKEKGNKK